jgi:hypothetical protein
MQNVQLSTLTADLRKTLPEKTDSHTSMRFNFTAKTRKKEDKSPLFSILRTIITQFRQKNTQNYQFLGIFP